VNQVVEEKVTKYSGEVVIKRYLRGKFLGKGGFAKCYEFQSLDPGAKGPAPILAAKIVQKETLVKSRAKQKLMSEIKIHRSVSHLHVVKFEHFFEDTENVYIILELCHNQSLNELLRRRKRLHELEVQCYTVQIISALRYLHTHRIIHRDLKLGNLFLNDKMEIKLGDFGLATKLDFDGEKKRTICGTPNYIAPEILEGKAGHSFEVDIWSLGVIIYTLIIGKPPFETSDVKTTYKRIRMNAYSFPEHIIISDAARDLITQILNSDPKMRPSLDEILEHEFLNHPGGSIPKALP
jgi:polo-like kinase 1